MSLSSKHPKKTIERNRFGGEISCGDEIRRDGGRMDCISLEEAPRIPPVEALTFENAHCRACALLGDEADEKIQRVADMPIGISCMGISNA